jgi:hypothetical protein
MSQAMLKQICQRLEMTPEQALEAVIACAFANAKIENPDITIEMVRKIAQSG